MDNAPLDALVARASEELGALGREPAAGRGPLGASDALLRAAGDSGRMAQAADDPALRAQLTAHALRDLAVARAGLLAELAGLLGDASFGPADAARGGGLARVAPLGAAAFAHYERIAAGHGRAAGLVRMVAAAHAEALRLVAGEGPRAAEEALRAVAADCAALARIARGRVAFLPDALDAPLDALAELQRAITGQLGGVEVETLRADPAERRARLVLRARAAQTRRLGAAGAALRVAMPFLRAAALAGGAAAAYLLARQRIEQLRKQVEELSPAALLTRSLRGAGRARSPVSLLAHALRGRVGARRRAAGSAERQEP